MCKHLKNAKVSAFCLTFSLSADGNVQYFKLLRLKWTLYGRKGRIIAKKNRKFARPMHCIRTIAVRRSDYGTPW